MGFFKKTSITNRADKISNFTVATAEYGAAVMEIVGTTRISGNVIYYDDFTAHEHRETQRSGKGGGSKTTNITYTYTVAIILGLCEGPIAGIGRVWKDRKIYMYPNETLQLTAFKGTTSQEPWAYLIGRHPEKALPYKGLAYMAGVIDLGSGGSLPNYNFEVKGKLLSTGDGIDVNPADYILYILNKVGLEDVEVAGIDNYRKYCREADLLISTPGDATDAQPAREIINEIASLTNAYMFWSNDRFKIVPKADRPVGNWSPPKTIMYDLTPDDLIEQSNGACVSYSRKDSSEVYNRFTVEFINRENDYEKESVSYEDTEDIINYGLRQAGTVSAHYIYSKSRAVRIAEELARKNKYERNKYKFKLDWAFCRLEVGDLITLTDPAIGLEKQAAMIDSVVEDATGLLTFTAVSRASGDYSEPIYDVHEIDRPYVDFNAEPGDTAAPAIFQPPSDLTSNGNELWVGAKGISSNWGGCTVYISDDNLNYRRLGTITNSARMGTLANSIEAAATSIEVAINGQLVSGTEQDAARANTLCWLDGECLSYTTVTMLANGNYRLDGCIRGQYNTLAASHRAGAKFIRCDEALLKSEIRKEDIGKTVWLKFASYNIFGAGEQSLADAKAYKYVITAYYIPPVIGLKAYNRYRQLGDGIARYDIVVQWDKPNMQTYLEGQVWYKTNHDQTDRLTITEGVSADTLGFQGEWLFGGSGITQCVIPQAVVGDSYKIAVSTKDEFGVATSPDTAPQITILVAAKTNLPNTPDDFGVTFGDAAVAYWAEVTNTDVVFYEIRLDKNAGDETPALLARTNGLSTPIPITDRKGTLYLYAKNATGKYSQPAVLTYNKPAPPRPAAPIVTAKLGGMSLKIGTVPTGCRGANYYINNDKIYSVNSSITYTCDAGIYDVQVSYVDIFGEGEKSPETRCTVKALVDGSMLQDEAISLEKVDANIQGAVKQTESNAQELLTVKNQYYEISQTAEELRSTIVANKQDQDITNELFASEISQTAKKISSVVTELGKSPAECAFSAVTQLNEAINLRVKKDDIITQINLSPGTVTIDGKLIHITGDTLIDGNVITSKMLQAKAVTADKLDVSSLSAISATIGVLRTATSGARTEIKDNLIEVYDENNVLRVRLGVW